VLQRPVESTQYASKDYRTALAAHGIVCSMSRRGDCWDNAVAESFFSTLKMELVYEIEYVEVFYNGQRRHSSLGYLSPVEFERRHRQERLAA
jgi:transposase InsO family protein